MAHLEARTEWWIRPDPKKEPKWKKLPTGGFKSSESLQPRHDTVEIQGSHCQSQTTSTTSANANSAGSDAAHSQTAQSWLDKAAANKKTSKATKGPPSKKVPRWPLNEFAPSAPSPLQRPQHCQSLTSGSIIIPSDAQRRKPLRLTRFNLSRLDHEQWYGKV